MKIEYLRTARHSYMIVKEADYVFEYYEVQMILHNRIEGLLPMQIIVEDGQAEYWYDVTGMQSLEKQYTVSEVNADILCLLLRSICDLKTQMENYMLGDENIVFVSRMVYYDRTREKMAFCYVPGYGQAEGSGVRVLLEEVLQHLDHGDSRAVKLGYDIYEQCAKVDFVVEDVNRCLRDYRNAAGPEEGPDSGFFDETADSVMEDDFAEEQAAWIDPEPLPAQRERRWKLPGKRKKAGKKKKTEYREVFETEQTPAFVAERDADWNPTVCFSQEQLKTVWELSYQGENGESSFRPEKFPYFLGKDEKRVDGVLHSGAVSRVHARILMEGDTLYVEDYNSTNGTYVNGRLIPMNTPTEIHRGDRIMLATEEYLLVDRRIPT